MPSLAMSKRHVPITGTRHNPQQPGLRIRMIPRKWCNPSPRLAASSSGWLGSRPLRTAFPSPPSADSALYQLVRRNRLRHRRRLGDRQLARGEEASESKNEAPAAQNRKPCGVSSSRTRFLHRVPITGHVALVLVQRRRKTAIRPVRRLRQPQSRDSRFAPDPSPRAAIVCPDSPPAPAAVRHGDRCCTAVSRFRSL